MKKSKILIRLICFVICFAVLYGIVKKPFRLDDSRIYPTVQGFYEEPEDSLDAVYLGASNVYAYWQAPLAWKDFGYAVYSMSVPAMPVQAVKYMIKECRKTQPDALYIVNINQFRSVECSASEIHYLVDYLPFSKEKVDLINTLSDTAGISGLDRLEFYFPIIRYHSTWSELESDDFLYDLEGVKAASYFSTFLKKGVDVSAGYYTTEERTDPTDIQLEVLDELLDYCEQENVKILFVSVPQSIKNDTILTQRNALADIITERGFDYVDLHVKAEEMGLDLTQDFYNTLHTNIHGSAKYTYYLGQYLSEHYDFEDKRDAAGYESWNEAWEEYEAIIAPFLMDFEQTHEPRDYELSAPELGKCVVDGQNITVSWGASEGAEGYLIYRRQADLTIQIISPLECIAEVDGDTLSYLDTDLSTNTRYVYTVVPIRQEDGVTVYGNYDISYTGGTIE